MSDDEINLESFKVTGDYKKIGLMVAGAVIILSAITIAAYNYAKGKAGTTVLPGGTTYLGPGTEKSEPPTQEAPPAAPSKFTADEGVKWTTQTGKTFPFSFSFPETLSLVVFPNDVTDSVAISWNNTPAQQNIMMRVADLNKTEPEMAQYINKDKLEYATNWWKQFSGLKGVQSVTKFTNSKGMTGYRSRFLNWSDQAPNEDVFFEVPGRKDLMVRFGNGILDQTVFDKIIDTFEWKATTIKPTAAFEPTIAPEITP